MLTRLGQVWALFGYASRMNTPIPGRSPPSPWGEVPQGRHQSSQVPASGGWALGRERLERRNRDSLQLLLGNDIAVGHAVPSGGGQCEDE